MSKPTADVAGIAYALRDVTVEYGRTVALDHLSLQVARGTWMSVLGRNGAGKSTLIKLLATLLQPTFGQVELDGINVARKPGLARRHLGYVPQSGSLDGRLTVRENLEFFAAMHGLRGGARRSAIDQALAPFDAFADRLVAQLSTGQKRRVEVARALMHDPDIVILDEATAGIDAQSRQAIWDSLQQMRQTRRVTVIMTSHFIEEIGQTDRCCILHKGQLLGEWATPDLLRDYGGQFYRMTAKDAAAQDALLAALPGAAIDPTSGDVVVTLTQHDPALLALIAAHSARLHVTPAPLDRAIVEATARLAR